MSRERSVSRERKRRSRHDPLNYLEETKKSLFRSQLLETAQNFNRGSIAVDGLWAEYTETNKGQGLNPDQISDLMREIYNRFDELPTSIQRSLFTRRSYKR